MKNTFGNSITITIFGESHGEAVGCVVDGMAPGVEVDEKRIEDILSRRRPQGLTDTARREPDRFKIVSGVFEGHTTGTPICILIPNEDKHSSDYERGPARPSHADLSAFQKYHGFEDYRGGGHFSGRITAALTAAGGIFIPALERLGIEVGSHIAECCGISDKSFSFDPSDEIRMLKTKAFPVIDDEKGNEMIKTIEAAREDSDSVGGVIATAVTGVPAGVGEPWFDSLEGEISHAVFSLGGVKGIEFGLGFKSTGLRGSVFNDPIRMKDGKAVTLTNNNGGINGGISNGMPILFNTAVKPTPSVARPQQTVDVLKNEECELLIKGRHDPAIIRRICPVIDCVTAFVTADMLSVRYGTDVLLKGF